MQIGFGRQLCGTLPESSVREWLVTDGLGGYAMGTVAGLRTRRYHGLLIVAGPSGPSSRRLGLAALDPTLVIGDRRLRLAVHEWASGAIDPTGHLHLESFCLDDGVPRWRWSAGDVTLEREVAMERGRPAVAITHRLVRADQPVRLELAALCTWRDAHGERFGTGPPDVSSGVDGFVFEGAYRVMGRGFRPAAEWYRGALYRAEAERGLPDREDLWHAGTFVNVLVPGEEIGITAWAGADSPPPTEAAEVVASARRRARFVAAAARASDDQDRLLAHAADQLVISGPTIVAGYPWFGEWSRDTMTSYEGLFLVTGRQEEGRGLLRRSAGTLSQGMLANTADTGSTEFNTADATLWFLHAVDRHVTTTGDVELAAELIAGLEDVVRWHVAGTRYGIRADPEDGLLAQGQEGVALTWMDARVDGTAVTWRAGKAVEINALWINGLAAVAGLQERLGRDATSTRALEATARTSFEKAFRTDEGVLLDVIGGKGQLRPNQLLAVSLPHAPLCDASIVESCARPLLTSLGLRSLAPSDPEYLGQHRGSPAQRDRAYHQGTVWPWLIGPYVEAAMRTGATASSLTGVLDGLEAHLMEWGLGSVSETADGDTPHGATGCPFQAWSVAELVRARRLLRAR